MDTDETPWSKHLAWQENPFRLELLRFHECISQGIPPLTPARAAVDDIRLAGDIIKVAMKAEERAHAD
jgi:predicted dehydrogenase